MTIGTAREAQIAPHPDVRARLTARLRSRQLDEALAQGTPPETAAPLALRARQLTTRSLRQDAADGLRRVIRYAWRGVPPSQLSSPPRVSEIVAASDELTRLADTLASPGPLAARGVAQAWILLTDGTGPLYNANSTANLQARAASAGNSLRLED